MILKKNTPSSFFVVVHFNTYLLLKTKHQTKNVDIPKIKRHPHVAKAFSYLKHIYKHVLHNGKLVLFGIKVENAI